MDPLILKLNPVDRKPHPHPRGGGGVPLSRLKRHIDLFGAGIWGGFPFQGPIHRQSHLMKPPLRPATPTLVPDAHGGCRTVHKAEFDLLSCHKRIAFYCDQPTTGGWTKAV